MDAKKAKPEGVKGRYVRAYSKGSTLSAALYTFDTLKLSDAWLLNAGLGWEKFHTETNSATFTRASDERKQIFHFFSLAKSSVRTCSGTSALTSPPRLATSRTRREEM